MSESDDMACTPLSGPRVPAGHYRTPTAELDDPIYVAFVERTEGSDVFELPDELLGD